jgi:cell division protein FtsQ
MMRKMTKIAIWLAITLWFVVVMGFVSSQSGELVCNRIDVLLEDTLNTGFVSTAEVRALAEASGIDLQGYPMSEINTRELEGRIEKNDFVRNAEVSKDITGRLEIRVEQREALVRIMPVGKRGFYLDTEGQVLPLSDRHTPRIMLASGYIKAQEGTHNTCLNEIYRFARHISADPFWEKQIVQLYVNRKGEYELIPRVGAHQILLGSMEDWEKKLDNLRLLYEQGLSREGWNTYGTINLKYTNQVICTKR